MSHFPFGWYCSFSSRQFYQAFDKGWRDWCLYHMELWPWLEFWWLLPTHLQFSNIGHFWLEFQACSLPWRKSEDFGQSIRSQIFGCRWWTSIEIWSEKYSHRSCHGSWTFGLVHHVLWFHFTKLLNRSTEGKTYLLFFTWIWIRK